MQDQKPLEDKEIIQSGFRNETYYEVFKKKLSNQNAILFLHGYPADVGEKNRDIAIDIHNKTNSDCYLIHYPGLGKSRGYFSFTKSKEAVEDFCFFLRGIGYKNISFIGHSWGGFLTLILSQYWTEGSKIILLSPFLFPPKGPELKKLVSSVYFETKKYLLPLSEYDVFEELFELQKTNTLESIIDSIVSRSNTVSIIQAKNDKETPVEVARDFVRNLALSSLKYFEIESDHSFSLNRDELIELVYKAMTD